MDRNIALPLGNFITWAGIISLPLVVYLGTSKFRKPADLACKYLALFLKVILIHALFWMPISYLLAGNLSFSFT